MTLSFIAALDEAHAIGFGGTMPWHLPDDLKFFKRTTMGKPMLMGRKTWESLRGVLPGRPHLVVSSQPIPNLPEGVQSFTSVDAALEALRGYEADEGFVIGGGVLFEALLPQADRLYLTRLHTRVPNADTFFPEWSPSEWKKVRDERHEADDRHPFPFTFEQWER
ncbi:MAG: dihydrofolate reductase [Sphingobacteriales bacterium]|nr:MAG: dihydrofolate reductase [Sphingobacteriales bacterium]